MRWKLCDNFVISIYQIHTSKRANAISRTRSTRAAPNCSVIKRSFFFRKYCWREIGRCQLSNPTCATFPPLSISLPSVTQTQNFSDLEFHGYSPHRLRTQPNHLCHRLWKVVAPPRPPPFAWPHGSPHRARFPMRLVLRHPWAHRVPLLNPWLAALLQPQSLRQSLSCRPHCSRGAHVEFEFDIWLDAADPNGSGRGK